MGGPHGRATGRATWEGYMGGLHGRATGEGHLMGGLRESLKPPGAKNCLDILFKESGKS